jgi:hypothetical protein
MKRRTIWILATTIVMVAAIVPLGGVIAGVRSQPEAAAPEQVPDIPDLSTLLEYPYPVKIRPLEGPERIDTISLLISREETLALTNELAAKGFVFDPVYILENAEAMVITVQDPSGVVLDIDAMTVPKIHNELSAALTAMQPRDQSPGFYQAHHTNLDPNLAEVPDPPIIVNGMPYFYITTLRWINGRILYWRYWWFDSHHHPNWYYAHYFWYWQYWWWYYDVPWPYWYWWVHGWYYWRYWYFWSTWFPWQIGVPVG